ncbi:MAG: hypothetical protein IT453_05770 [Planctomycetes bacterium]|nr:hypothetical protein [Planctomycetota bacterium]
MLLPILVSVLPVFSEPATSSGPASTDLLRFVPRDALLVAHTAPLDTLRADVRANAWWQLATDPTFASLWQHVEAQNAELASQLDGLDPRVLCESIHGQTAMFVASDATLDHATIGFLVEPGADATGFDAFVSAVRTKVSVHLRAEQDSHAGITYELWGSKSSDTDVATGDDPSGVAFVRCGGVAALLVDEDASELRAAAHGLIDRVQAGGVEPSMATHPGLLEARGQAHGQARAEFFLDLAPIGRKALAEAGSDDAGGRWVRELGLADMRWVHARADFGSGENLDLEVAVKLSPTGALTSWLSALHVPSSKLHAKIPADAVGLSLAGFDVHGLWNDVWATFGRVDEQEQASAQRQLAQVSQAMGGLDFERDVISQFSGEFASFTLEVPKEEAAAVLGMGMFGGVTEAQLDGLPSLGEVFVIGVRDPLALEGTLEELFGLIGIGELIASDDVEGQEVYYAELGDSARMSWWFGNDCVALSAYPTALRKTVVHAGKTGAPSAATDPRFAKALAENSDACSLSIASTPTMIKSVGGVVQYLMSMEDAALAGAVSAVDWKALVDRYVKGTTTCTVRHQGGELRMHLRTR